MIQIRDDAMYSKGEADELLRSAGVSLEALFDRFGLRSTYRHVILGAELLALFRLAAERLADGATRNAGPLTQSIPAPSRPEPQPRQKPRRSKARGNEPFTVDEIKAIIEGKPDTARGASRHVSLRRPT